MGYADEEYTCESFPRLLSPSEARKLGIDSASMIPQPGSWPIEFEVYR